MNILFTTNHPAQIHNFRPLREELQKKDHNIFWIATEKDISRYLLIHYQINYKLIKKPGKDFFSKVKILIINTIQSIRFIRKNKIDLIISRVSPYLALAGLLTNTKHIALADTESSGIYNKMFVKFTNAFLTSKTFKLQLTKDQIRFDGNIELFYLHPKRFQPMKREEVANLLGIEKNEPYIIMRFVSWDAYHDKGLSGFTDANKLKAAKAFSKHGRVFISSESELQPELEPYRIKIPPEKMHDVLAHATLFFGESSTMASESAVLGTPAIFMNYNWFGVTEEEENYNLLYSFKDDIVSQSNAIEKGLELLQNPDLKVTIKANHKRFMENKIDVTGFMLWFIEKYPESARIMKENPDYQYRFR
ncbi:MAG: DUF354 domain-containing protein [bacterium]